MDRYIIVGGKYVELDEDEAPTYGTRIKESKRKKAVAREGVAKQSFESNPDVQRWLSEAQEAEGAKEP